MNKSKQNEFRFLSQEKRSNSGRFLGVLTVFLVLSLPVLLIGRTLLTTFAASPQGNTAASSSHNVTVDFGSRQNHGHPIPSQFLGIGGIDMSIALSNNGGKYVPQAGFHFAKMGDHDYMSEIFPTLASMANPSQQNWTRLDQQLTLAKQYNLQPMITLAYTPSWLQPQNQTPRQTNACLTYSPPITAANVKPMFLVNGQDSGTHLWGKLAALIVAHVDQQFPQAHSLYEIWNQPDGNTFLCMPKGDKNGDADRVTAYKAIYAAAAPLMRAQASKDGTHVKIGGPALVYALQSHLQMWLPALLNDPAIYPYVDFISYHRYLYGKTFSGGGTSLVGNAQDSLLGVTAEYEQVARAVRAGKQPNAARTPIYVDEYNMNPCEPHVCRNDPTYSPLDNGLFVVDYLNAVNDTKSPYGAAGAVPAGLAYYTWFTPLGNLCMFGVVDQKMDCGKQGSPLQPYPQYYAYDLLGGANYLDITNGGYVAGAASTNQPGVYAAGFYTRTQDNVVIVNTTSAAIHTFTVLAQNAGKVSVAKATIYTVKVNLGNPAKSITTQQVTLTKGQNGYTATVDLPAFTMIGISFAAQ
ncbi:MAG TPA: hypothetical protein DHV65_12695 [Ktedonobacter sp.]|nr:hypothetical protein [Ktedonobacter sp.]